MPFDDTALNNNEQDIESNETIVAPTQATVERINVSLGDNVSVGDTIVVLTAMKMEVSKIWLKWNIWLNYIHNFFQYVVKAQIEGNIEKLTHKEGDSVRKGELLVKIKPKI